MGPTRDGAEKRRQVKCKTKLRIVSKERKDRRTVLRAAFRRSRRASFARVFLSLKCPKWRQYFRKKGRMRRVGVLHGGMPLSLRGLGLPGPRGYETRLSPRVPLARTSPASSWAGGGSEPGRPALRCSRRHLTRNAARSHTPVGQGQVPSVPWVKTTQSFAAQSSPRTHRLRRLCYEGHRESKAP